MIVADTNLIAYLLIQGEHQDLADRVLDKDPEWIAPVLWRSELRNVIVKSVRGGLPREHARRAMDHAEALLEGREYAVPSADVLNLAFASRCSAYDCEFVALAQQKNVQLVTSDRGLRVAFPETTTDPVSFVGGSV